MFYLSQIILIGVPESLTQSSFFAKSDLGHRRAKDLIAEDLHEFFYWQYYMTKIIIYIVL